MKSEEKMKKDIKKYRDFNSGMRNSMGCDESWYNPYFAIAQVFNDEEIDSMSENELNNLVSLADAIADALY